MAKALNADTEQLAVFSDRLSPVFVKELRQGLRANHFVSPFILAQVLGVLAVMLEMLIGHFGAGIGIGSTGIFLPLLTLVFFIVLPLTLFGSLQPEISIGRNVELLLMSNLSRWQIVLGKFFVACSLATLMMVSLLPYLLIRYFVGNVEILPSIGIMFTLLAGNALMSAIVIGASGIKNYVGRIFLIGFIFTCYSIVSAMLVSSLVTLGGWFGSLLGMISVSALFIILSLQLGRAKLRIFENPLDPPSIAVVMTMIALSPVLIGISKAFTFLGETMGGIITFLATAGFIVVSILLDRGPGKKKPIDWAQP